MERVSNNRVLEWLVFSDLTNIQLPIIILPVIVSDFRSRVLFQVHHCHNGREGIRTPVLLQDMILSHAPLTGLGYPPGFVHIDLLN